MRTRFCVDCMYCFITPNENREHAYCRAPLNYEPVMSPVTGSALDKYLTTHKHCRDQRILGKCGPDAAWFEPITQEIAA